MRKLIFGLLGFAALGFGALSAQPAVAQPYYGYGHPATVVEYRYERPRPVVTRRVEYRRVYRDDYRPYRPYRPYPAYRPVREHRYVRPVFAGPRCTVRIRDVWNGYRWVQRQTRTCRY